MALDAGDPARGSQDKLWEAVRTGELVDTLETVRAEQIVEVLTARVLPTGGAPRGLRLSGVEIAGDLDLEGLTIETPLTLSDATISGAVVLDDATMPSVRLIRCRVVALSAMRLATRGDLAFVELTADFVDLHGARIGGSLILRESSLGGDDAEFAFDGTTLETRQRLDLRGLKARGCVLLDDASAGLTFNLAAAQITAPGKIALGAQNLRVGHDVVANRLRVDGETDLTNAAIGGRLYLEGAQLANDDAIAFAASGMRVGGSMFAPDLNAEGEVRLIGAKIGGTLDIDGGQLDNQHGKALGGDNLQVGANVRCGGHFTAKGELRLNRARIGVSLILNDATLENAGDVALELFAAEIGQHLLCHGLTARGTLLLGQAQIGGTFALSELDLSDPGDIDLKTAHVHVLMDDAWPRSPGPTPLHRRFGRFRKRQQPPHDRPYQPRIDGLTYDTLGGRADEAYTRIDWIAHADGEYVPQAYDQLVSTLRREGREEDARDVAIAKQRRRRQQLRPTSRVWNRFLDWSVGYGYRAWRAVYALLAVMLVGWGVFAWASWDHLRPLKASDQLPQFAPWLYSIDAVLPVINFGQESSWAPTGAALYWYAFSVVAGWILGTALIAALTAMLNRS